MKAMAVHVRVDRGFACQRRVDKAAHDLRGEDAQSDAAEQHDGKQVNRPRWGGCGRRAGSSKI
jgi:hypothetical protein